MDPETGARVAGSSTHTGDCTSAPGGLLHFHPPAPQSPKPGSHHSSHSIHPTFVPMAPYGCPCACVYMYARLLTCVSHRSLPSCRLPSRGDAWVPPVNFTAFICPDEWRAALSVPLPAISSGSLEPHSRFARPFSLSLLPVHTQTHTAEVQYYAQTTRHVHSTKCQSTSIHQLKTHTLKAHKHKEPANPPSLFLRFFLVAPSCSKKYLFQFLGERQKKSHLSSSLAHAKIINAFQRGPLGATPEERRQEDADIAPGLRLEIISEEQSLGLFYSYQDSSYLTCILVFTQSPP